MKQNIIIVLLTILCGLVSYIAIKMTPTHQTKSSEMMTAILEETDKKHAKHIAEIQKTLDYINQVKESDFTHQRNDITDSATISIATPHYPAQARENGVEGDVKVEIVVEPNGTVSSAKIIKSSGSLALDNAALNAAKQAKVSPKKMNGIPVRSRYIAPFRFKLS